MKTHHILDNIQKKEFEFSVSGGHSKTIVARSTAESRQHGV